MIRFKSHFKKGLLFILCVCCFFSCVNDPVGEDYFNDTAKIKGGEKPSEPVILEYSQCEYDVTFTFCCKTEVQGEDTVCLNDVDSCGTDADGDVLTYYLYVSDIDPAELDESDFYNLYFLYNEVSISEPLTITSSSDTVFHFWLTAWDGGRQSDKSNIVSITFPSETACPE